MQYTYTHMQVENSFKKTVKTCNILSLEITISVS